MWISHKQRGDRFEERSASFPPADNQSFLKLKKANEWRRGVFWSFLPFLLTRCKNSLLPGSCPNSARFQGAKSSGGWGEVLRQSLYHGLAGCAATENPSDIVEDEVFSIEAAPPIELGSHRSLSLS